MLTAFLLLCGIITGCAENKDLPSQSYETKQLTFSEPETPDDTDANTTSSTSINTTTSTLTAFHVNITTDSASFRNRPDVTITKDKVTIKYGGKTQEIDNPQQLYYDSYDIDDYNFDNNPDIFFRFQGSYFKNGDYWLWDSNTDKFIYSEELAMEDGKGRQMTLDRSNKTILINTDGIIRSSRDVVLKWEDGKIIPISMKISSWPSYYYRTQKIVEYEFDKNDDIIMTKSYHVNSRTGVRIDDDENTPYLRVTDDSVQLMKGSEIFQTMSFNEIFGNNTQVVRNKKLIPGAKQDEFGISLIQLDYDLDGTKDLCINLTPESENDSRTYVYYLMDTKTGKYKRWDSLLDDGRLFIFDEQENCICTKSTEYDGTYYYKWENDHPVLLKRTLTLNDGEGTSVLKIYRYDEDGNEYEAVK